MNGMQTKIGTGMTLVALGGLAGYAVNGAGSDEHASAARAAARQPVEVRTQTIHRTVRVVKREKPRTPRRNHPSAGGRAAADPAPTPVAASAPVRTSAPPRVSTPRPPVHHPVTTRTSGGGTGHSGGGEHENEHENERGDD